MINVLFDTESLVEKSTKNEDEKNLKYSLLTINNMNGKSGTYAIDNADIVVSRYSFRDLCQQT